MRRQLLLLVTWNNLPIPPTRLHPQTKFHTPHKGHMHVAARYFPVISLGHTTQKVSGSPTVPAWPRNCPQAYTSGSHTLPQASASPT